MVQILPFSGWRYDLSQVGALSEVTAPAVAVMDKNLQQSLYRQHPCNAVRLIANRDEPGDTCPSDRIDRAVDFLRVWKREGVLIKEHESAFYVIESQIPRSGNPGDASHQRWSLVARVPLPLRNSAALERAFGSAAAKSAPANSSGTNSSAGDPVNSLKASDALDAFDAIVFDREQMMVRGRMNLAPVTVLVGTGQAAPSVTDESLLDLLEQSVRQQTPVEHIEENGIRHRLWAVTDKSLQVQLEAAANQLAGVVIAGQEEFLATCRLRDELISRGELADPNHPAHSFLAWIVPVDDSDCDLSSVLFRLPCSSILDLRTLPKTDDELIVQYVGNEQTACADATELASLNQQQPCMAIGTADGHWAIVASAVMETTPLELRRLIHRRIATGSQSADENRMPDDDESVIRAFGHSSVADLAANVSAAFGGQKQQIVLVQPGTASFEEILRRMMSSGPDELVVERESIPAEASLPTGFVFAEVDR